jgi:hypothetical protein
LKAKDNAYKIMIADKAIQSERVNAMNAADGVAGDFVMKMPGVLGSVATAKERKGNGEVVVNVTGKRRLSLMIMAGAKPCHYHLLNWVCVIGAIAVVSVVVYIMAMKRVDKEVAGPEGRELFSFGGEWDTT